MRVLVTGITGGVGWPLFQALCQAEGFEALYGLYRDESRLEELRTGLERMDVRTSVEFIRWDLGKPMDALTLPVDAIVHSAALRGPAACNHDTLEALRCNGLGTRHLADFALRNGAQRFLFFSIQSVYHRSALVPIPEDAPVWADEQYQLSKLVAELELERRLGSRLDYQILRLAHVYGFEGGCHLDGILKGFLDAVPGGCLRVDGDGNQTVCFLHIKDLCSLILQMLSRPMPTGIYNVASETLSVRELAQIYAETTRAQFGEDLELCFPNPDKPVPAGYGLDTAKIRAAAGWNPRERVADFVADRVAARARSAP